MRKPLHHETLKKKKEILLCLVHDLNDTLSKFKRNNMQHLCFTAQVTEITNKHCSRVSLQCFMCFSSHTVTFSRRLLFWTQTVTGMRFVVIKRCYSQFNLLSQAEWGNELPRGSTKQTEGLLDKLWKNDLVDGGWRITERKRLMSHSHEGNQSQLIKAFLTKIIQCCQKVFAFFLF